MAYDETLEEELKRILDEGSASAQPMELADEKARLAQLGAGMTEGMGDDLPRGTKVNFAPEAVTPPASRVPMTPKVVDLTQQSPDDIELAAARAEDRMARSREAFERGSRQLVAGLTRTQEQAAFKQSQDAVAQLLAARKAKGDDAQRAEQNRLGAAKFNYDQAETSRKTAEDAERRRQDLEERAKDDDRAERGLKIGADNAAATRELAQSNSYAQRKEQASDNTSNLRKEFNALPDVKAFNEVDGSYRKIQSAAVNDSPAGDIALLTGYMKMIDPGSTVREGEFATAQNAGSVPDKLRARYNSIVNGERLAPAQRADFLKQSKALWDVQKKRYDDQVERYRGLAGRQGASPDDIISQQPNEPITAQGAGKTYKAVGPNGEELVWDGAKWVKP